jgi:hypothetical protein
VKMTHDVLTTATAELLGGDITAMPLDRLRYLITVTQHATDLLLNEIEVRGELTFHQGVPIVPYHSEHMVPTILTRDQP